ATRRIAAEPARALLGARTAYERHRQGRSLSVADRADRRGRETLTGAGLGNARLLPIPRWADALAWPLDAGRTGRRGARQGWRDRVADRVCVRTRGNFG